MAKASNKVLSFDDVSFDFWGENVDQWLVGVIKDRGSDMVIEIPRQKAQGPYLIIGAKKDHIFMGTNSATDANATEVRAEWCKFSDQYTGVWIEEGDEMLFRFRLPRR